MATHEEWFEVPLGELSQGDVLRGVDVYTYQRDAEKPKLQFRVQTTDVVVLTQSCDISKLSQQSILVAEVDSYDDVVSRRGSGQNSQRWRKKIVANGSVAEFLIPPCSTISLGWSLVNFRSLFVVPKSEFEGERLTGRTRAALASPYREHLSQAYARFVMRVGLPDTLHDFEEHEPPKAG